MLSHLSPLLAPHGLVPRGALHPANGSAGTLVLVGSLGGSLWAPFHRARRAEPAPLDTWTRRVIEPLAESFGARALYPFDGPPWHPFLAWAQLAEGLSPSPIGVLIHPTYGPWHSYRAALAFPDHLPLPAPPTPSSPCTTCIEKPCLSACPVAALTPGAYDVPACAAEARGTDRGKCAQAGCAARRACPVGAEHRYPDAQLAFHMAAFLRGLDDTA